MALVCRALLLAVLLCVAIAGCGEAPQDGQGGSGFGGTWLGIPSAVMFVVEQVNEGTNWILNKNSVSVVKIGEVRAGSTADLFLADFNVSVTNGKNSLETTTKDVPCDKDGIPTEESINKLREAVEDIKAKIKRLQN